MAFESVAGIAPDPAHPGFDRVLINPQILPALSPVAARHDCRNGRIDTERVLEGDLVRYSILLPQGSTGILMPNLRHSQVEVDGKATDIPAVGLTLTPGKHEMTFRLKAVG